jgi:hypothetical protein
MRAICHTAEFYLFSCACICPVQGVIAFIDISHPGVIGRVPCFNIEVRINSAICNVYRLTKEVSGKRVGYSVILPVTHNSGATPVDGLYILISQPLRSGPA